MNYRADLRRDFGHATIQCIFSTFFFFLVLIFLVFLPRSVGSKPVHKKIPVSTRKTRRIQKMDAKVVP